MFHANLAPMLPFSLNLKTHPSPMFRPWPILRMTIPNSYHINFVPLLPKVWLFGISLSVVSFLGCVTFLGKHVTFFPAPKFSICALTLEVCFPT